MHHHSTLFTMMTDSNPSPSSGTPTHPPPRGGPRKRNNNNNNNRPQQHNNNHQRNNNKRPRRGPNQKPAPPPKPLCSVCSVPENAPSYKCPKCRDLYCSVACCKQHKEVCKGTPPTPPNTNTTKSRYDLSNLPPPPQHRGSRRDENDDDDDDDNSIDEGWKITDDMKEAMDKSKWLHQELQSDGGLRAVLSQMVASSRNTNTSEPQDILQDYQERYPTLRIFLDKLSVSAGVLERQHEEDEDESSDMNDLLQRNWVDDPPTLTLKPIFRKSTPVFEPVSASSSSSSSSSEEESGGEEEESSSEGDSSSKE